MSQRESPQALRQLTVRGFDRALERHIRARARREGLSLNRVVLRMLREAARLAPPRGGQARVGDSLDHLVGTWSAAEAKRFREAVADFEQVDEDLWA